jgi:hypothetical protein
MRTSSVMATVTSSSVRTLSTLAPLPAINRRASPLEAHRPRPHQPLPRSCSTLLCLRERRSRRMMWMSVVALLLQATNLVTAETAEGRLFRATNAWARCAAHVAEGLLAQRPGQDLPQTVAEASADVCSDESAIVRSLARELGVSQGQNDPEGFAEAVRFEMRNGIITNLRNAIAAGARRIESPAR